MQTFFKYLFSFLGAIWAIIEPTLPFIIICIFAMLIDCFTAFLLNRRVKNKYGETMADGKFKSEKLAKVFDTMIKLFLVLILCQAIQIYVLNDTDVLLLPNIVAGAFCFCQLWSILENESSCNNAKWAKVLQKIMIDKTKRHFNVDLEDKDNEESKE